MSRDSDPTSAGKLSVGSVLPAFDSLSEKQRAAIENGPGWVTEAVSDLPDFANVDDFIPRPGTFGSNNFFALFMGGAWQETADNIPAFQRLAIVKPGLIEDLRSKMAACTANPDKELWEELYFAHNTLRQLVDAKDPGVFNDGKLMYNYLLR